MSTNPKVRAWVHVRADALRANYARIEAAAGADVGILPMVKADAYGLGIESVSACLGALNPWGFGVATVHEGVALRTAGVERNILVCAPCAPDEFVAALAAGLDVSVSSVAALRDVSEAARTSGRTARIHVDVDTGMGRSGFDWRRSGTWMPLIAGLPDGVEWRGIFTHFHSADEAPDSVALQRRRFDDVVGQLSGVDDLLVHDANSAAILRGPSRGRSLVRPGIFLYGGRVGPGQPIPEAVASLHARVVHVREAERGTTLGYGATYEAEGPERWATLSIGYGDGLPRALGNRGSALVDGVRVPIIGRISMDVTVVDITDAPDVRVGSVATLIGAEGDASITIDDVAEAAGTISYEVLTGLTSRLPRVWSGLDA